MNGRVLRAAVGAALLLGLSTACTSSSTPDAVASARPAAGTASAAPAAVAPRCSTASLKGRYLYEVHGDKRFTEGRLPYLEVGEEVYDGAGRATSTRTDSVTRKDSTDTATYTVDADCRGLVTYASGLVQRVFVSPAGEEFTSFEAGAGAQQTGLDGGATRVSTDPTATCSADSLRGTYSYRARGFYDVALHVEHGFETYGSAAVTNSFSTVGDDRTQFLTGSYRVDPDCRAHVTYDGGPTFTQYLAPDGSEFFWMQVAGFAEKDPAGLFGGHEHRVTTSTDPALTRASS